MGILGGHFLDADLLNTYTLGFSVSLRRINIARHLTNVNVGDVCESILVHVIRKIGVATA